MEISFYLKRPTASQETVIFARITYEGFSFKYYLPEKINSKYWSKETQRAKQIKQFAQYPEFNQRLQNIIIGIEDVFRKYVNDNKELPTPEIFKQLLDREIKKKVSEKEKLNSFFGYFQDLIQQSISGTRRHPKTSKPLSKGTIKNYTSAINHLSEFQKTRKKRIDFKNIDLDFYTDYTEFLIKKLKLSSNTIGKDIQVIKMIMNDATERGINTNLSYKSKRFITIREKSDNIYLNENEIEEIENLDLSNDTRLERVRDLFLIGCYTGLRYSDYSILQPEQMKDGFIETTQIKTGDPVAIPIHPTVKRIVEKYNSILPASISNQNTNVYLKELGKKVVLLQNQFLKTTTKGGLTISQNFEKWELLCTHTARRSFATNEYKNGTPAITIMAITGHKTEKAFLRYIKLTPKEHAKLLKLLWQKRFALKAV
jgi:integrase